MEAWFRSAGLWRVVSGSSTRPTRSNKPTTEEEAAIDAWELKSDKAAGQLFLMVEQAQRVHFNGIKDDPVKMWAALRSVHMQQRAGTRFNAYDDLFPSGSKRMSPYSPSSTEWTLLCTPFAICAPPASLLISWTMNSHLWP